MKTAILFTGNIRTWNQTKEFFIKAFDKFDYDTFVSTYNLQYGYHPHIKGVIGNFEDNKIEEKNIKDLLTDINLKNLFVEDFDEYNKKTFELTEGARSLDKNCYGQFRKLVQAFDMMKQYENENNFKYDYIIKTRFDLVYENEYQPVNSENCLVVDSGNVFPNDCIYGITRNSFEKIVQFMNDEFFNSIYKDSFNNPPHGLLLNACKHNNITIQKQKLMNFVLRKGNLAQKY